MRVLHITSPLLLLGVCACHHVSSELGLVDSGASSPNSQGLARFQDVDGDGVASAGDFITLSFDRSVKLTVEDASNILLGGPGDTLGAGATLEPGAIASEARVILGEGAVLRARGLGTGAPAEDENQPSVLRVQGGVQDADGGGTLKDTDWIDLVAEPSLGSDLGLSGLGVRAEAADLNLDGLLDWIVAAGEAGLDVYEAQADGSYSRIALSFDSADGLAVADLHGAGRIDIVAYSAEGLRVFVNQSPLAGPISFASGQEVPVDSAIADMLAHDVDGDGDNDLALLAADGVRIVDNSGAGLLEAPGSPIDGTPVDGSSLSLVDLGGDGSGDLVVARDGENVLVPLELSGRENGDARERDTVVTELLERVGLGDRTDHYPAQLSGGEQQRVALARAFANRPRILFADEPTGNLDARTGETIIDLMVDLNREAKTTLVLVTHDPELASRARRVVRLSGGEIVDDTARTVNT